MFCSLDKPHVTHNQLRYPHNKKAQKETMQSNVDDKRCQLLLNIMIHMQLFQGAYICMCVCVCEKLLLYISNGLSCTLNMLLFPYLLAS